MRCDDNAIRDRVELVISTIITDGSTPRDPEMLVYYSWGSCNAPLVPTPRIPELDEDVTAEMDNLPRQSMCPGLSFPSRLQWSSNWG